MYFRLLQPNKSQILYRTLIGQWLLYSLFFFFLIFQVKIGAHSQDLSKHTFVFTKCFNRTFFSPFPRNTELCLATMSTICLFWICHPILWTENVFLNLKSPLTGVVSLYLWPQMSQDWSLCISGQIALFGLVI